MKVLRSIVSLVLAALVLVASSSFTVNMHLCGGSVQSVSLIEKAEPCAMEKLALQCKAKTNIKKSPCCEDEELTFEGNDFNATQIAKAEIQNNFWIAIAFTPLQFSSPLNSSQHSSFSIYKPPLLQRNIPVLIQSFLI